MLVCLKKHFMDLSTTFVFATVVNAGFFAWQFRGMRKEKKKLQHPVGTTTELNLLKTALDVEKTERHRVANDLHYKSSSTIAAVKMYFNAVHATQNETELKGSLEKVHALLDSAYAEINKSLYSLMPEVALEHGIDEAVRKYCSHLTTHRLLSIEYDSWGTERRYHEAFELSVFRFVQMLINYILQHDKATIAIVQMGMRSHALTIAVEDNGTGYRKVQELAEDPYILQLEFSILSLGGQMELQTDNGLSAFIQLDTAAFGHAKT